MFKVDLHLAYKKTANVNNNTAYIFINKLPSNYDNNKTEYQIVTQNQHAANKLYITLPGQSGFNFLIFCLKDFRLSQFFIVSGTIDHIFGAM